jgi:endonuclease G, mitochondrial
VRFWKIAVALTSENQPFAAGFVLDQSEVIAQFGIEVTEAPPFAPFKTYQVAIAEIERLTGLTFKMTGGQSLSEADPLADGPTRRSALSRAGVATTESTAGPVAAPYGYVPLYDGSTIVGPKPFFGPRRDHADPGPKPGRRDPK